MNETAAAAMVELQALCSRLGALNRRLAVLDEFSYERPALEAGVVAVRERMREVTAQIRRRE